MSRIATIALVALLSVAALASTAHAGEVGYVEFKPEESPAPQMRHVLLYGETSEEFLGIYADALRNGFVWLTAPARTYVRKLKTVCWVVIGYLDPSLSLAENHDLGASGEFETDGQIVQYVVLPVAAPTAEGLILKLQTAFAHGLKPVSLPRVAVLPNSGGQLIWTIDAVLFRPLEPSPVEA